MRAYRPGRMLDEHEEELREELEMRFREEQIRRYAKRIEAGLSLFEPDEAEGGRELRAPAEHPPVPPGPDGTASRGGV